VVAPGVQLSRRIWKNGECSTNLATKIRTMPTTAKPSSDQFWAAAAGGIDLIAIQG
jgi:hypothetical protein